MKWTRRGEPGYYSSNTCRVDKRRKDRRWTGEHNADGCPCRLQVTYESEPLLRGVKPFAPASLAWIFPFEYHRALEMEVSTEGLCLNCVHWQGGLTGVLGYPVNAFGVVTRFSCLASR
jgi:hypothetical protein